MGVGAVMAWMFSVWASVQRMITVKKDIQQRENRITQLEEDVERYRMELEEQRFLPASQDPLSNAMQPETAEMVG
jgi:hypothetical protein